MKRNNLFFPVESLDRKMKISLIWKQKQMHILGFISLIILKFRNSDVFWKGTFQFFLLDKKNPVIEHERQNKFFFLTKQIF